MGDTTRTSPFVPKPKTLMADVYSETLPNGWQGRYIALADRGIIVCLGVLLLVLPMAHVNTIRDSAIVTALLLWAGTLWLERRLPFYDNPLNLPIILFSVTVVSSLFFSWNLLDTLDDIRGELLKVFALYYLVADRIRRDGSARHLLLIFFMASIIFCLFSIHDFFQHGGSLVKVAYRVGGLRDPSGGQVAGLIHCMVLAFLIPSLSWWRNPVQRILLCTTLILNFVALYMTFTRAAWLAIMVQCLFLVLAVDWPKWLKATIMATLIAMALSLPRGVFHHGERSVEIASTVKLFFSADDCMTIYKKVGGSTGHRLASYRFALDTIAREPFVPHGWGLYLGKINGKGEQSKNSPFFDPMNSFLAIAYQTGVQGLLAFLFLLWNVWKLNWIRYKSLRSSFPKWFHLALLLVMIGFFVNVSFGMFYKDESALLLWLFIGMSVGLSRQRATGVMPDKQRVIT